MNGANDSGAFIFRMWGLGAQVMAIGWVLGTTGPIARRYSICKTMRGLRDTRNSESIWKLRPSKFPSRGQILRDRESKFPRNFIQPEREIQGRIESIGGFKKTNATVGRKGGGGSNFRRKASSISESGGVGVKLKAISNIGDRDGVNPVIKRISPNGDTDRFKAQCPIWA